MATDVLERMAAPLAVDRSAALPATGPAIPPLAVGGLVVSRAALVAALRLYVPQLVDVEALDGGRFLLHLAGDVAAG